MKKLIFILTLCIYATAAHAQIIIEISNPERAGFGVDSDCRSNQYMDLVVNGPLVQEKDGASPVGGYIDNGVQVQPFRDPSNEKGNYGVRNGIFGVTTDGIPFIYSYNHKHLMPKNKKWAIQNGPILVSEGVNLSGTSQSKAVRSGFGITMQGKLIFIYSDKKVTFREFSQMFVSASCLSAIYLDGANIFAGYSTNNKRVGLSEKATKIQFFHQGK